MVLELLVSKLATLKYLWEEPGDAEAMIHARCCYLSVKLYKFIDILRPTYSYRMRPLVYE